MFPEFPELTSINQFTAWSSSLLWTASFLGDQAAIEAFSADPSEVTVGEYLALLDQAEQNIVTSDFSFLENQLSLIEDQINALPDDSFDDGMTREELLDQITGALQDFINSDFSGLLDAFNTIRGLLEGVPADTPLRDGLIAAIEDETGVDLSELPILQIPFAPFGEGTAWVSGDPHLKTLDGESYDFQAAGEFVLLRSATGGDFEVQARMVPLNDNVSVNEAVATRLGANQVMIDAAEGAPELRVNGTATALASGESIDVGNGRIQREGDTITVIYPGADGVINNGDSRLSVQLRDGRLDLNLRLDDDLMGAVEGLLGDGDGNPDNDIARADGTVLARPLEFAELYGGYRDDWRVDSRAESLFSYAQGEGPNTFYQADKPAQEVSLDTLDPGVLATARQAALNAGIEEDSDAFAGAVLDFALTGDSGFLESALSVPDDEVGTAGADTMTGNAGDDGLRGLGGDDLIRGNAGTDTLDGGAGADVLVGGPGGDLLLGGDGDDILLGDGVEANFFANEAAQVFRLYRAVLDRDPDFRGHLNWTDRIAVEGRDSLEVTRGFVNSPEFQARFGGLDSEGFVTLLYQNVLGRDPDAKGLARWTQELESGTDRAAVVVQGFSDSLEFKNDTAADAAEIARGNSPSIWADDVFRVYQATLDRAPDLKGYLNWSEELGSGTDFLEVTEGFTQSREFQQTYGSLDNEGFVSLLYNNVLGRNPDAQGLANWTGRLDGGTSRAEVVRGFAQSGEFVQNTSASHEAWVRQQGTDDVLAGGAGNDMLAGGRLSDTFVFGTSGGSDRVVGLEAWDDIDLTAFGYANDAEARGFMSQQGDDMVFSDQGTTVVFEETRPGMIDDEMILV